MGVTPNKARCRLCVLLVIIVSNYYLCLVSSGPDSLDEADSYVDRLQSSCPPVKLRGLVNHRKKTRKLTLIEAYIWLSMMTFTYLLRSIIAHITALLLRAGDVELNPGPGPPPTTSSTQAPSDGSQDAASLPPNVTEASNTLSNPELKPETPGLPQHQVEAQQVTSDLNVPTERKVIAPAIHIPPVVAPEPHHFLAQKDEAPRDDRDNVEYPAPQHSHKFPSVEQNEPKKDESLLVEFKPYIPQHVVTNSGDYEDDFQQDSHAIDDDLRHHYDFEELRPKMSLEKFEKMHRKQITESVKTISESVASYQEPGYEAISEDNNCWIKFVISANKLLRVGIDCEFCPICFRKKPGKIESHIFPCGLLTVFKRIHCSNKRNESSDYIYDFSRGVRMGPQALSYPMLCETCEELCDEQSLRKLYIFLMDKPDMNNFKVPSNDFWLQRVLANIMFRGLVIADNLPKEFQDDNFKQKFKDLREYCKHSESRSVPDFRLFLLPNQSIDKDLIAFIYPFEYILRSPMFSTVIRDKKNGICFIYSKFDCFHLVLPLDRKSSEYFSHFQEGLETSEDIGGRYVDLRWTLHGPGVYERKFNGEKNAVKYSVSEQIKPSLFPEILLKISLDQYTKYLSMIYSHSKKSDLAAHCKIMIEFLPGLDHEYPTKDFLGATAEGMPEMSKQPGGDVEFSKLLSEDELSPMIARAAAISPFALQQIKIEEYSAEIKQTKEELEKKSKQLKEKEKELEDMKEVMENFKKAVTVVDDCREQMKYERSRSLEMHLALHNTDIQSLLNEYQRQLFDVHMLWFKEKRELNHCLHELNSCHHELDHTKKELKKSLRSKKTIKKNLKASLDQMSTDLKELQQHSACTRPEFCNKLLQRCEKMLKMIEKDL